jgi:hypothetical protein
MKDFYALVYLEDKQYRMGTVKTQGGGKAAAVFNSKNTAKKWLKFADNQQGVGKYQVIEVAITKV